ncbi:oxidoreductase [Niastella koreensis]|uniref:MOSC domain containing protein n=2 Tax=Niastella koreensis TaxID=354356 RepID=G8TLN5_NIAKG|nr:MOSC N-terminal beta barrel domain-containing protein [Niastella koreensis]AEV96604.1 MOSC domain containing protein [Niastella koreensis GR20-10]OQP54116.1 oxidoreductase [Niastella koreensis]
MLTVSELYIYPIKSLGGIALNSARLTDRGFEHDRRWMLVDDNNQFITQREVTAMALLKPQLTEQGLLIRNSQVAGEELLVPFEPTVPGTTMVDVWSNRCRAQQVSEDADAWFSKQLGISCKLMYMPHTTNRFVDGRYAHNKEITSFSDGFPLLMIGQASLDDLNNRLTTPLPMNRFRPNVVFTGGTAFLEDTMKQFEINGITFFCVKPCARCVMTTIDQQSGAKAKEPLTTLSTYRKKNNKILFGQNVLFKGRGEITVGNTITIQEKGTVELIPD